MSKSSKIGIVLLALVLVVQLFALAAPAAFAEGPAETAAIGWSVKATGSEGHELTLTTSEEVESALGKGFSVDFGKDASGAPVTAPTVADLRRAGVTLTPPAGYVLRTVMIVADGSEAAAESRSLLSIAGAKTDAAGAVVLPAAIFAESYDASAVGAVFNGSGERYTIRIELERVDPAASLTVSYTAGTAAALPSPVAAGGDSVELTIPEGAGSADYTVAALDAQAGSHALTLGKIFTGWKLSFSNGASAIVKGGDKIVLCSSAVLEAQWQDAIIFSFTGGEKEYDGTPLTASYNRYGELKGGDELIVPDSALAPSRTDAGESEATLDLSQVHVMRGEEDVTGEYEFVVRPGTLRIVQRGITFTVSDAAGEYSALPLMPSDYTISSGSLAEGHSATPTYSGQQTLPGTSTGSAVFKIRDGSGNDVSANYNISVINGSITVVPRTEKQKLTVTVKDMEKEYDGASTASGEFELSSGSLLGSDKLAALSFEGGITGVGQGSIKAVFAVKNGESDVTENYEITVVPGKLVVKPRPITITADSATKEFDGTALTKNSYTISSGSLVKGHTLALSISGSQTKVGSSANVISAKSVKVTDPDGKDVTAQYALTLKDGTLTVTSSSSSSALTVTIKSVEKVYDGKALAAKDYEITSGALAEGDKLVPGAFDGELTNVGEKEVKAAFTVKNGETDVTDKYTITVVPGKLTVKARPITITAASASKIYDGSALTRNSWSITSGELVSGHKLTATVVGSQTQTGSSANSISKNSIKITDASGADVTANYAVTTATGTLTVGNNPVKDITLSVGEHSKVYDGKAYRFTGNDIRVTGGTLPAGYSIDATFNPESVTDVGKYDVTIKSVTIRNASGADVTNQFNISRSRGSYTISERELVIETKAANKVYDGEPLTERSTPNITGRVEDHQVTLRITGTQTKVGSSDNTVADVKVTDKTSGADVTKNYAIRYQYGLLTVSDESGTASEGPTWVGGSAGTLFIKLDHDYDGFEGLQIDGKDLDRSVYTSASGSTEIWLKAAYLNTLSDGSHTLKAKYSGGESVETVFSIEGTQTTQTARRGQSGIWLILMLLALLGCLIAAYFLTFGSGKGRRWKRPLLRRGGAHKGGDTNI